MNLENIILSEIRQLEEDDKYHMISLIYKYNEQTELTSKIETDSQRESRGTPMGGV